MKADIQGTLEATGMRTAIVIGRFNEFICRSLLESARDCLVRHGASRDDITTFWVPGAFEIPLAARTAAASRAYDAVICLGAVIRGATPHFDYVASVAANGIAAASQTTGIPVIFGVLTTDTIEQAIERAGTKAGNKGWDAAAAAIEMVNLLKKMK